MKKIIISCVALVATFICAATVSAQGIKIHKVGSTDVINIPASELDYIETYDAPAPFEGTWKMKKLNTDKAYMDNNWNSGYDMITFGDTYPTFNSEDQITFADGKIIPNFKSTLKNYFIGEATYEIVDEKYTIHPTLSIDSEREVTLLKVKGVNRNFDPNSISEDDEAFIGVRLVEDDDADEPGIFYLEIYLIDYESTSFAPEWNGWYNTEKPVANIGGMAIFFSMEKATNAAKSRKKTPSISADIYKVEGFNQIIDENHFAIIFFGASWSGPTKIARILIEKYVNESPYTFAYGRVYDEIDETPQIIEDQKIIAVPTTIVYKDGKEIFRFVGWDKDLPSKINACFMEVGIPT